MDIEKQRSRNGGALFEAGTVAWLAVVIGGITLFRLVSLWFNRTDLFVDEAQYWSWSRELDFGYYSKPPLLAWLIAGATAVCGDGEVCVRAPSALIHAATSAVVFLIGRELYSTRVGLFSALTFVLLPGISLSGQIISTDVPLLFAWAVALLAFIWLYERPRILTALMLGTAIGIGLNAKYAMAYFFLGAAVFFVLMRGERRGLGFAHLLAVLVPAGLLITPNILWNASHQFATFRHTSDNANWTGSLFHPGKAAEFFGAQFGVFGPILFGAFLVIIYRMARGAEAPASWQKRLLVAFSLPLIAVVTVQGLLSHALANWAAPAYVAATVLVVAHMVEAGERRWFMASFRISIAVLLALTIGTMFAGKFTLPGGHDPFARTLGNRELAAAVSGALAEVPKESAPVAAVLTDDRDITAALLYYGRDNLPPVRAWRGSERPTDHYQLTRPCCTGSEGRLLYATYAPDPQAILGKFRAVTPLGVKEIHAGQSKVRRVSLYLVDGFVGDKAP